MFNQIYNHFNLNNENLFKNYKKQINEANYKSLVYIIHTFMIFSFFSFIASFFLKEMKNSLIDYLLLFILSIIYILIVRKTKPKKCSLYILYLYLFIVSIFFIVTGIILKPISTCTFLCILIIINPIFILDNHFNIVVFNTIISVLAIIGSYHYKSSMIFSQDMINIIGTYILSIFLTLFLIDSKISDIKIKLELKDMSQKDELTKLYNRSVIPNMINDYLQEPLNYYALIIFDLDNFKSINDTYGHNIGDNVLKNVSNILKTTFRNNDVILRLGGDEFIVFMKNINNKENLKAKANELIKNINSKVEIQNNIFASCSAGIVFSNKKTTFKKLYKKADEAMYKSKEEGKNKYNIFYE